MIAWRRLREVNRVRRFAVDHQWNGISGGRGVLRRRLSEAAISGIGHSRRFRHVYRDKNSVAVASYVFETGMESNRATHSWRVAMVDLDNVERYAILTCESQLAASARRRGLEPMNVMRLPADATPKSPHQFFADDGEYWTRRCVGPLAQFFTQQSRERTWEILPGLLVAYEAGPFVERDVVAMVDQVARCAQLLSSAPTGESEAISSLSFAGSSAG